MWPKCLWSKRHFYSKLGQNITLVEKSQAEMSLARISLSQMSLAQKCSGQNVFVPFVQQPKFHFDQNVSVHTEQFSN